MGQLATNQWLRLLDAVGQLGEARSRAELAEQGLRIFDSLIPSDLQIIVRVQPGQGLTDYHCNEAAPFNAEEIRYFETHPAHHPLVAHIQTTGDRTAQTISNILSHAKWMESPHYRNCRHRLRLKYSLAFSGAGQPGEVFGITLDRVGRDFLPAETEMLELLRPHFLRRWQRLEQLEQFEAEAHGRPAAYHGGQSFRRYVRWRELGLSQREADVLQQLANGAPYKQISAELGITRDTVRTYIRRLYQKLDVRTRTDAVVKYLGR